MLELRGGGRGAIRRACLFFFELTQRAGSLLRDVYRLARACHWSERDILSLTLDRRLAYLLLLEEESDAVLLADLGAGGTP